MVIIVCFGNGDKMLVIVNGTKCSLDIPVCFDV